MTPPAETAAPSLPTAISVNEACTRLNISRSTFGKLAAAGSIKTVKLGGRRLCPANEIVRILNSEASQ